MPTDSSGILAGYRFNRKRWLAVEGDYDYFRNDQRILASGGALVVPMNVHAATGTAIVKLPAFRRLSPFVLGGRGAIFFDARGGFFTKEQTRGAFVCGGGPDVPMFKHVALRAQYRGFIHKIAADTATLKLDKYILYSGTVCGRGVLVLDRLTTSAAFQR